MKGQAIEATFKRHYFQLFVPFEIVGDVCLFELARSRVKRADCSREGTRSKGHNFAHCQEALFSNDYETVPYGRCAVAPLDCLGCFFGELKFALADQPCTPTIARLTLVVYP